MYSFPHNETRGLVLNCVIMDQYQLEKVGLVTAVSENGSIKLESKTCHSMDHLEPGTCHSRE